MALQESPLPDEGQKSIYDFLVVDQTPLPPTEELRPLSDLLERAYTDITSRIAQCTGLQGRPVPSRPAVYLLSRTDMEAYHTFRTGGLPEGQTLGAYYDAGSHTIFLPDEETLHGAKNNDPIITENIYEEVTHALTTFFDETSGILRIGFIEKTITSPAARQKILDSRQTVQETFQFNQCTLHDLPSRSLRNSEKNGEMTPPVSITENITAMVRLLLTRQNQNHLIVADKPSTRQGDKLHLSSNIIIDDLLALYRDFSGRDISTDLLNGLVSGQIADIISLKDDLTKKTIKNARKIFSWKGKYFQALNLLSDLSSPDLYITGIPSP